MYLVPKDQYERSMAGGGHRPQADGVGGDVRDHSNVNQIDVSHGGTVVIGSEGGGKKGTSGGGAAAATADSTGAATASIKRREPASGRATSQAASSDRRRRTAFYYDAARPGPTGGVGTAVGRGGSSGRSRTRVLSLPTEPDAVMRDGGDGPGLPMEVEEADSSSHPQPAPAVADMDVDATPKKKPSSAGKRRAPREDGDSIRKRAILNSARVEAGKKDDQKRRVMENLVKTRLQQLRGSKRKKILSPGAALRQRDKDRRIIHDMREIYKEELRQSAASKFAGRRTPAANADDDEDAADGATEVPTAAAAERAWLAQEAEAARDAFAAKRSGRRTAAKRAYEPTEDEEDDVHAALDFSGLPPKMRREALSALHDWQLESKKRKRDDPDTGASLSRDDLRLMKKLKVRTQFD